MTVEGKVLLWCWGERLWGGSRAEVRRDGCAGLGWLGACETDDDRGFQHKADAAAFKSVEGIGEAAMVDLQSLHISLGGLGGR